MTIDSDLFVILKRAPWKTRVRQYITRRLNEEDPVERQCMKVDGVRLIRQSLGWGLYDSKLIFEYAEAIITRDEKFDMKRITGRIVARKIAEEIAE